MSMNMNISVLVKRGVATLPQLGIALLASLSLVSISFAADDLGNVAENVIKSFESLTELITAVSYIAGLGFAIGAIMKFKQHKDNPTQIPIGTPIALLFIAAALLFLPTILDVTGETLFGSTRDVGGPGGIIFGEH